MTEGPAAHVRSLCTASPEHRLPQRELADFAKRFFGDLPGLPRLLSTFGNAGIDERQLARPVHWYEAPHTFAEKNEVYRQTALALSQRAAERALDEADTPPERIAAIVFVSSTGISTPSLDAPLSAALGLAPSTMRVPIWGLGCAGGAAGLSRAAALCTALRAPVLLVSVEVCSVTFVQDDHRKSNVIATALFGDGAAAVVLSPQGPGPRVLGGYSHLLPDTEYVMGWDLQASGLAVRFSPEIPAITHRMAPVIVEEVRQQYGLPARPERLVLHPGGPRVIDAYQDALQLPEDSLAAEREVLRRHGNMSGPTVLFVLGKTLDDPPPAGAYGLVLGLGPGFCAEGAVLAW
ncbi:MAG: stilbene synthase [Myxococcota bacterium]